MLKILRRKGVSKTFLWIVAAGIIVMFGFGGQVYLFKNQKGLKFAGTVFGKKISLEEFDKNYKQVTLQGLLQYGKKFNQIREYLDLEAQTWDRIILLAEAKKRKLKVSNQDVIDFIQTTFGKDGVFDVQVYNNMLKYAFRINPRDYEEGVRNSLKISQLFEKETLAITVPDEDILAEYKFRNEKIQLSYALFEANDYADQINYDEQAALSYFEQHKIEFTMPPSVNVEYVRFDYPQDATEEQKEQIQERAYELAFELQENRDFLAVAQKNNLTVNESGFFSPEDLEGVPLWPLSIMRKISKMRDDDISEPLETDQGYVLLRIKERKGSFVPEYGQVQEKVKTAYLTNEAKKIAKQKATESLNLLQGEIAQYKFPNFKDISEKLNLKIDQTPVFGRGQYLPNIGISKNLQDAAFSLTASNPLSEVVEIERGYCILFLENHVEPDLAGLEKEKQNLKAELLQKKKNLAFADFIAKLRLKANLDDNVSELFKQ